MGDPVRLHSQRRACDLGASLLEAAAVLPVFLIVVLGLIDFARYVSIKNTLEIAAHQALTLAEVIPDLEYQDGDDRFESARAQIIERALLVKSHPLLHYGARMLSAQPAEILKVPEFVPANASRDFDVPLTVSLKAEITLLSVPWNIALALHGQVSGFREPKIKVSYPISLNCQGKPPILNEDILCDCPDGYVSMWNGCHACDPGKVKQNATQCVCAQKSCGPFEVQDSKTCACTCAPGAAGNAGSCSCNSNSTDVNGACVCKSKDELHCRDDQVVDPTNCSCACANPLKVDQNGACVCQAECPATHLLDPNSCQCYPRCSAGCSPRLDTQGKFLDCDCGGGDD